MGLFRRHRMVARTVSKGSPVGQSTVTGDHVDERLIFPPDTTVRFDGAYLTGVDLSNQETQNIGARGSRLEECDLEAVVIANGVLSHTPPSVYRNCNFTQVDLRGVSPLTARFEGCRFVNALLDGWDAVCAEFVGCEFAGRLVGVKCSGTPLGAGAKLLSNIRRINEFSRNDFRKARLVDCRITGGIDLDDQLWPSGPEYIRLDRLQERIRCARKKIEQDWAIGVDRDRTMTLLDVYSRRDYALQQGLILQRDDVYSYGPWTDRLWLLLEGC